MSYTCLEYMYDDGTTAKRYVSDGSLNDDDSRALELMSGGEWDDFDDEMIDDLNFVHAKSMRALPPGCSVSTTCRIYMYAPTWEELCKNKT